MCVSGPTCLRYSHSLDFYEELNFNKRGNVSRGTDLHWLWSLEGSTDLKVTSDGIYCNKEAQKSATFFVFLLFCWAFEPYSMYKVKKKRKTRGFHIYRQKTGSLRTCLWWCPSEQEMLSECDRLQHEGRKVCQIRKAGIRVIFKPNNHYTVHSTTFTYNIYSYFTL